MLVLLYPTVPGFLKLLQYLLTMTLQRIKYDLFLNFGINAQQASTSVIDK